MDKLKMHSPDLTQDNIAKIRKLFPGCVTEAADDNGKLRLAIDFDQLKNELSESIVEGPQERYHLNWPGKREALITANAPIAKTLRPARDESVDFDTTQNLFIEGDNLEALKLLQETYLGKVKMIYIDPPYNTGKDFVYKDSFAESNSDFLKRSGQEDEQGSRLVANTEANGRFHSVWLSMILPRLKLARNLLTDEGVVFISIDDREIDNLLKVCNEVFGEKNYLGTILWKKKTNGNNTGYIPPVHDYIVCFGKTAQEKSILGFNVSDEYLAKTYSNPDSDPRGPWTTSDLSANHEGPYFEITNPNTGVTYWPPEGRYWVFNETEVQRRIDDGRIIFGKTGKAGPIQKKYLSERTSMRFKPESWWDKHGLNEDGTAEMADLFAPKVFDHPKPTEMVKRLVEIGSGDGDIVLDFFAGSGSTFHSTLKQSANDGLRRVSIAVQLPEELSENAVARKKLGFETLPQLTKERIRRAGQKILKEECHPDWNKDVGFRVLKIDSSNMANVFYTPDQTSQADLLANVDSIKQGRTSEDLLFQVLVDWGVDLTLPIRRDNIQGKTVFFVDENALVACFDTGVTEELVKELAGHEPLRVVFRDTGFVSDAVKINVQQIFKQLSPMTDVKAI
ncbi:putative methyltransferase [Nereida ignava]|uniref:site-specific DNA-methyltransferase (adenine-specific) n=1 Tax=Nereida ignava TaxID=282199 RepID=A0A0U1NNH8_9RHOB|nr:site-specific DNA-methyltransferase [Nereida ignava]CRK76295.1 putative methyltransferase [Nereida ignava]SFJ81571.1 adenine-specific DNA-methyltransferase [Nereida ignava DSM 16309]